MSQSKLGLGIVMGFLVLMMLSFAAGDISKFFNSAGSAGSALIKVGGTEVTEREARLAADNALQNARQRDPKITMKDLLGKQGFDELIRGLVEKAALLSFAKNNGLAISDQMIAREINQIEAFRGADGTFSEAVYRQLLQQRGLTEEALRDDIAAQLASKQILVPAAFGTGFPQDMTQRYLGLLREHRTGAIALLPSAAFAPSAPASDADLQTYYAAHRQDYVRPERRVIRYATFGEDAIKAGPAPTEAEVVARYEANRSQYAASETRKLVQLVVPTEAAAKAILAEVQRGKSLELAATTKGLATATLDDITRDSLASQSSAAVADATFSASRGALVGPVRSGLGWHLLRVEGSTSKPARSLDQVRGEITSAITAEKKRKALNDFAAEVDSSFGDGGSLGDVAKELNLTPQVSQPLTADGAVYGKPGETAPAVLSKVLSVAFSMDGEGKPQLAEIEPGKSFIIFEAATITASAPAPLAEIRDTVAADFAMKAGADKARQAADRLAEVARKGGDIAQAIATLGTRLPPADRIDMSRDQLRQLGQNVPPPLRLLFSMAHGTTKILPGPRNRGFYVVQLRSITPGTAVASPDEVASVRRDLAQLSGRELAEQLRGAISQEVGVNRNEAALTALSRTLTGAN